MNYDSNRRNSGYDTNYSMHVSKPTGRTSPYSYSVLDYHGSTLFVVTFLGVVPVTDGYRWDYQITNIGSYYPLNNWVLGMEGGFSRLKCFKGDIYSAEAKNIPVPETPVDCSFPSSNPNFMCPYTDPCSNVTGLKYDHLNSPEEGELGPGKTQRFSFIIRENLPAEPVCFQLQFGNRSRSGEIYAPGCICKNPCNMCEEDNDFTCDVMFPDCFTLDGTEDDVRVGYCIKCASECVKDGTCKSLTTINVCGTDLQCCVPVQRWRQEIDFQVIFNVPIKSSSGSDACIDEQLYACCIDDRTAINNCFTCIDDQDCEPPCEAADCENTEIVVTGLTPIEDRYGKVIGVTIEYTFVTPPCGNEVIDE